MNLQRREGGAIHELDDVVCSHLRLPFSRTMARVACFVPKCPGGVENHPCPSSC
jgi:hypothetical protein